MKKLIIAIVCPMIIMIGCEPMETKQANNQIRTSSGANIYTIEYDSCEYVIAEVMFSYGAGLGITHKGKCKYCENKK